MEPERQIEKLLRAFARKRRAQTDADFQLHPATRRLLQGEIRRRVAVSETPPPAVPAWNLFRQRVAFLLTLAFITLIGAALLLPSLSSAKRKASQVMALNNLKQIGLATRQVAEADGGRLPGSLDGLTNGLVSDKTLIDPQSGKPFTYLAGGQRLQDLPADSVLAYAPEDRARRAVLYADGSAATVDRAKFADLTNRALSQLAWAKTADRPANLPAVPSAPVQPPPGNPNPALVAAEPPAPPAPLEKAATFTDQRTGVDRANAATAGEVADAIAATTNALPATVSGAQNYAQSGPGTGLQNAFRNSLNQAGLIPVLANFQVRQNGNDLSVVDGDGSVYHGSLQLAEAPAPAGASARIPGQMVLDRKTKIRDLNQGADLEAQNYSFRVSGTNQTLKQNVVFIGNLQSLSNQVALSQSPAGVHGGGYGGGGGVDGYGQNQPQSANPMQSVLWSNSRITGTAVISETNQLQIDARSQLP